MQAFVFNKHNFFSISNYIFYDKVEKWKILIMTIEKSKMVIYKV